LYFAYFQRISHTPILYHSIHGKPLRYALYAKILYEIKKNYIHGKDQVVKFINFFHIIGNNFMFIGQLN